MQKKVHIKEYFYDVIKAKGGSFFEKQCDGSPADVDEKEALDKLMLQFQYKKRRALPTAGTPSKRLRTDTDDHVDPPARIDHKGRNGTLHPHTSLHHYSARFGHSSPQTYRKTPFPRSRNLQPGSMTRGASAQQSYAHRDNFSVRLAPKPVSPSPVLGQHAHRKKDPVEKNADIVGLTPESSATQANLHRDANPPFAANAMAILPSAPPPQHIQNEQHSANNGKKKFLLEKIAYWKQLVEDDLVTNEDDLIKIVMKIKPPRKRDWIDEVFEPGFDGGGV